MKHLAHKVYALPAGQNIDFFRAGTVLDRQPFFQLSSPEVLERALGCIYTTDQIVTYLGRPQLSKVLTVFCSLLDDSQTVLFERKNKEIERFSGLRHGFGIRFSEDYSTSFRAMNGGSVLFPETYMRPFLTGTHGAHAMTANCLEFSLILLNAMRKEGIECYLGVYPTIGYHMYILAVMDAVLCDVHVTNEKDRPYFVREVTDNPLVQKRILERRLSDTDAHYFVELWRGRIAQSRGELTLASEYFQSLKSDDWRFKYHLEHLAGLETGERE